MFSRHEQMFGASEQVFDDVQVCSVLFDKNIEYKNQETKNQEERTSEIKK